MKTVKATLIIAGTGPEEGSLRKIVKESGLTNKVIFLGTRSDVSELLKASDVFVLPSLSEGLPIVVLEAMAAKTPCVVTEIGLPVEDGETGIVVPPKNVKALANGVNALIHDKELARKVSRNGFELVRQKFRWDNAAREYVKLAKELAEA